MRTAIMSTRELFDKLLQAAENHGAEEIPDHEVGDLREILQSCWEKLTEDQKREVYEKHLDLVTDWGSPCSSG